MVDVVIGIVRRRPLKPHALLAQVRLAEVNLVGDQGQDDATRLLGRFRPLAEAEEAAFADAVDATIALIERQRQAQHVLVEIRRRRQIARVKERDVMFEGELGSPGLIVNQRPPSGLVSQREAMSGSPSHPESRSKWSKARSTIRRTSTSGRRPRSRM